MRLLAHLATLAAGFLLALVVAYWGWQIVAPAPLRVPARAPTDPVTAIVAADLFGGHAPAIDTGAVETTLPADTRLLGVIAEPAQQGYALFKLPSGFRLVAQGQTIVPGVTLASVEPFGVTIASAASRLRPTGPAQRRTGRRRSRAPPSPRRAGRRAMRHAHRRPASAATS